MERWLRWICLFAWTLAACLPARAQTPVPTQTQVPPAVKECLATGLTLPKGSPAEYRLGHKLRIVATGDCAALLKAQYEKAPDQIGIRIDGVVLDGLRPTLELAPDGQQLTMQLQRIPAQARNRTAWDTLFGQQHDGYRMELPLAVQIGSGLPVVLKDRIVFNVVTDGEALLAVVAGLAIFVAAFVLMVRSPGALRDSHAGRYSLGRSQMAFWGLLVLVSFCAVWALTHTVEYLPVQTLMLMGISGATGIAAVMIGSGKDTPAQRLAKLDVERDPLMASQVAGTLAPADALRLTELDRQRQRLIDFTTRPPRFWRDICDDGEGVSFHRIQVVLWTLALGVVFVWTVAKQLSMPEFPETLLLLMGISSGTYLGFKFPEKV